MIDLYSSPTPNGRKITIMLEELGVEYNPIFIDLDQKKQFSEDFSKISPSNKIPVIVDKDNNNQTIFESGAILLYLAKKYNKFVNEEFYWEIIQWVFFQMAYVGPMLGQAHQYLFYNPGKSKFAEEKTRSYTKHIYEILDKRLSKQEYFELFLYLNSDQSYKSDFLQHNFERSYSIFSHLKNLFQKVFQSLNDFSWGHLKGQLL